MGVRYLDTGVFVTPLLRNREPAVVAACEDWLRCVARGEFEAVTSYLTWDEVTHVAARVPKPYSHERARRASALLLGLGNLRFMPVDEAVVKTAEPLLSSLKP